MCNLLFEMAKKYQPGTYAPFSVAEIDDDRCVVKTTNGITVRLSAVPSRAWYNEYGKFRQEIPPDFPKSGGAELAAIIRKPYNLSQSRGGGFYGTAHDARVWVTPDGTVWAVATDWSYSNGDSTEVKSYYKS